MTGRAAMTGGGAGMTGKAAMTGRGAGMTGKAAMTGRGRKDGGNPGIAIKPAFILLLPPSSSGLAYKKSLNALGVWRAHDSPVCDESADQRSGGHVKGRVVRLHSFRC